MIRQEPLADVPTQHLYNFGDDGSSVYTSLRGDQSSTRSLTAISEGKETGAHFRSADIHNLSSEH